MTIIVSVGVICFVLGFFSGAKAADARDRHRHTRPLARRPYEAPTPFEPMDTRYWL